RLPFTADQPAASCRATEFGHSLGPGTGLAGLDGPYLELRLFGKRASQGNTDAGTGAVHDPALDRHGSRDGMHDLDGDRAALAPRSFASLLGAAVHERIYSQVGILRWLMNACHGLVAVAPAQELAQFLLTALLDESCPDHPRVVGLLG